MGGPACGHRGRKGRAQYKNEWLFEMGGLHVGRRGHTLGPIVYHFRPPSLSPEYSGVEMSRVTHVTGHRLDLFAPDSTSPSPLMSSSQNSQQPLRDRFSTLPPSVSVTGTEETISQEAIEKARGLINGIIIKTDDSVERSREILHGVFILVHHALKIDGDPNIKERLRSETEFRAYINPGSSSEQEFIELLRRTVTATDQMVWRDLLTHGIFFPTILTPSTLIIIFYL